MRKIALACAAAFLCALFALGGCSTHNQESNVHDQTAPQQPVNVRVAALKGPTAMGMVKFMDEAQSGLIDGNSYAFEIAASPDMLTPKIAQGELDIAAVPANLASVLYNNLDEGVQVLAVNTLGVLYLCDQDESVHGVSDLAGKTIYAAGKGSTPEYALRYILQENGLTPGTDVTIEWKSEHAECVAALAENQDAVALLPQPFVTVAQSKNESIRVALDLTKEWDALQKGSEKEGALITGVVIARSAFVEEHPEVVADFLQHYQDSVAFVNENIPEASALVEQFDIAPAAVAQKAIPACNIVCISGDEMKNLLSGYLEVLHEQSPEAVGGSLPSEDFYYDAS